jgi:hypothetical protein
MRATSSTPPDRFGADRAQPEREGRRRMPAPAADEGPTPRARLLVAAGVAIEALLVAAGAVASAVTSATGSAQDRVGAIFLAVTALALAVGLGTVALGVRRGLRWARTPTLVWQALQVLVAVTTLPVALGIPLAVLGVAVGYGVLRRDVVAA